MLVCLPVEHPTCPAFSGVESPTARTNGKAEGGVVTEKPDLLLTTSPFLKQEGDTAFIMWQVNYALIPVVAASVYFFGIAALLITAAATAVAAARTRRSRTARRTASATQ